MAQPGRKSQEAVALAPYRAEPARLRPSPGLSEPEGKLFADIVLASSPGHFQEVDRPLLDCYVRAWWGGRRRPGRSPPIPTMHRPGCSRRRRKPFAWSDRLAMRLRCSPQARAGHVNPASKLPRAARSYYDRNALEDNSWNPP